MEVGSYVAALELENRGQALLTRTEDMPGITYDDAGILAHYSSLVSRDPSAVMLWSDDWPVFNGDDFWVVEAGPARRSPALSRPSANRGRPCRGDSQRQGAGVTATGCDKTGPNTTTPALPERRTGVGVVREMDLRS